MRDVRKERDGGEEGRGGSHYTHPRADTFKNTDEARAPLPGKTDQSAT